MENTIEATIPEFKKMFEGSKDVVFFFIHVRSGKVQWKIEKRFSELSKFHEDLSVNHGALPSFPKKTLFPLKNYEDIEARRIKLNVYIQVS